MASRVVLSFIELVTVDEAMDFMSCLNMSLVAVKLDIEVLSNSHMICFKVLAHTDHSTVARFVRDGLKVLRTTGVHGEKVLSLHSYAAAYMLKAATTSKFFYPNFIYFTRLTHALQCVTN
jgi:hypothetical protein